VDEAIKDSVTLRLSVKIPLLLDGTTSVLLLASFTSISTLVYYTIRVLGIGVLLYTADKVH